MERKNNNKKTTTLITISALAITLLILLSTTPTPIILAVVTPQQQQPQPLQAITGQANLTGNLTAWSPITVTGQSIITGNLQITNTSSNANLTISPTLTMTNTTPNPFTMDTITTEFHQGYPLGSGGQITINGTTTTPANFTAQGNITIGAVTDAAGAVTEDCLNQQLKQYYTRFTTGPGGAGYIGDYANASNTTKIDVRAPIKVNSGSIQTYTYLIRQMIIEARCHLFITINTTHIEFYLYVDTSLGNDYDRRAYQYYPTYQYVNLSQMAHDRVLPTLTITILIVTIRINMNDEILNMETYESCYSSLYYIRWGANTDFESWSVSSPQNPQPTSINPMVINDGLIRLNNTRMQMLTWDSAYMNFTLNSTTSSAIRVVPSPTYPVNSLRVHLEAFNFSSWGWTTGGSVLMVGLQNLTQTNVRLTSYSQTLTSGLRLDLNGSQWFPASTNVTIQGGLTLNGTLDLQRSYDTTNKLNLTLSGYVSMPGGYSYISPNNITMTGTASMTAAVLALNMTGNVNVTAGSTSLFTSGSANLSLTTTGTLSMNMSVIVANPMHVSLNPPMSGSITSGSLTLTASGTTSLQNLNLTLTSPSTKLNASGALSLTGTLNLTMSTDNSTLNITSTEISVSSTQDNPLTLRIQGSAAINPNTAISLEMANPSVELTDGTLKLNATNTQLKANITSSGGGTIHNINALLNVTPSKAAISINQLNATLTNTAISLNLTTDNATLTGLNNLLLQTPSMTINATNTQLNITTTSTVSLSTTSPGSTNITISNGNITLTTGTGTLNATLKGGVSMQGNIQLTGNAEINMPDNGKITLNGQLSLNGTLNGTLDITANANITTDKTTITLSEGSTTLNINSTITLTGNLEISGGKTIIQLPSTTITLTGTIQLTQTNLQATTNINNLNLQTTTQNTTITIGPNSNVNITSLSGLLSMTGSLSMDGRTVVSLPSGSITLDGSLQLSGASLSGSLSLQGVSLSVLSVETRVGLGAGSNVNITSLSGLLSMTGSLSMDGRTVVSLPSGSITLDGSLQLS
ncbi:MAG: hypothetical protein QXW47_05430, partial [Candidatus Jordarchaeales archaeon]